MLLDALYSMRTKVKHWWRWFHEFAVKVRDAASDSNVLKLHWIKISIFSESPTEASECLFKRMKSFPKIEYGSCAGIICTSKHDVMLSTHGRVLTGMKMTVATIKKTKVKRKTKLNTEAFLSTGTTDDTFTALRWNGATLSPPPLSICVSISGL